MRIRKLNPGLFRNGVFGAEDSLVSTVGVLFGVSTAIPNRAEILLTGIIVIAVEALSMGAGAFSTESSAHEANVEADKKDKPWMDGLVMFSSYFLSGLLILAPYLLLDISLAKAVSVATAVVLLFLLGYIPTKKLKSGLRTVVVATLAVVIGYFIGTLRKVS